MELIFEENTRGKELIGIIGVLLKSENLMIKNDKSFNVYVGHIREDVATKIVKFEDNGRSITGFR